MANWYIKKEDLEGVYPPKPPQVDYLESKLDSSLLVNSGPGTGKTITAIMKMANLIREGNNCLYIAPTSLSLKYVQYVFRKMGLQEHRCITMYKFEKLPAQFDVILVDDSHRYSLEQVHTLESLSQYLLLFGDYHHITPSITSSATINELVQSCQIRVFPGFFPSCVPSEFLQLIPYYTGPIDNHSSRHADRPAIIRTKSFEEQLGIIRRTVEEQSLEEVAILGYTRDIVRNAYDYFINIGWPVEVFLPGREKGLDTLDFTSRNPKILTIASSSGIHFKTVFVIGFDSKTIWKDPEDVLMTVATRPTEYLYFFYVDQLPEPLASMPQSFFRDHLLNDDFMINI